MPIHCHLPGIPSALISPPNLCSAAPRDDGTGDSSCMATSFRLQHDPPPGFEFVGVGTGPNTLAFIILEPHGTDSTDGGDFHVHVEFDLRTAVDGGFASISGTGQVDVLSINYTALLASVYNSHLCGCVRVTPVNGRCDQHTDSGGRAPADQSTRTSGVVSPLPFTR